MESLPLVAKKFAIHHHQSQTYNNHPYSHHLEMVVDTAIRFRHVCDFKDFSVITASCWLHDVVEDCDVTREEIESLFGESVARIISALTQVKGLSRKERVGTAYLSGIRDTNGATFVKLCDRISNVLYAYRCYHSGDVSAKRYIDMYAKENVMFKEILYREDYKEMFDEIGRLLNAK